MSCDDDVEMMSDSQNTVVLSGVPGSALASTHGSVEPQKAEDTTTMESKFGINNFFEDC